jgi:hypothetical protein
VDVVGGGVVTEWTVVVVWVGAVTVCVLAGVVTVVVLGGSVTVLVGWVTVLAGVLEVVGEPVVEAVAVVVDLPAVAVWSRAGEVFSAAVGPLAPLALLFSAPVPVLSSVPVFS